MAITREQLDTIPERYWRGSLKKPVAGTVGQLKRLLRELPDNLRIESAFGERVQLTVFNIGRTSEAHLQFDEAEDAD